MTSKRAMTLIHEEGESKVKTICDETDAMEQLCKFPRIGKKTAAELIAFFKARDDQGNKITSEKETHDCSNEIVEPLSIDDRLWPGGPCASVIFAYV